MNFFGEIQKTKLFAVILLCLCIISSVFISVYSKNAAGTDKITASAGRTEDAMTAVYAYGGYTVQLRNAKYLSDGKDDGIMLTDRKYTVAKPTDEDEKTEGWVMAESRDGENDFRVTVTVDFGFTAKDVLRFYLRAYRSKETGAEMPYRIRFYTSDDGEEFQLAGEGSTLTDITIDNSAAVYSFTLDEGRNARYFRAVIDCRCGYALWLNEVGAASYGNVFRANSGSGDIIYDSQGLLYRIENNEAAVIGTKTEVLGGNGKVLPSSESFDTDGRTYILGAGSGNEVTVISDFIGEDRLNYSGVPNNIQYIVIHNTGTTEEVTDAERYNYNLHHSVEEKSWHYTVDENLIYHSLADSVVGWHAGSSHNYESIGIEICVNGAPIKSSGKPIYSGSAYEQWVENRFKKSLRNAAVLVAELLTRYGLSTDAVIQHYDVTEKNCPLWMREKDGKFVYEGTLWVDFMGYIEEYYTMLNGDSPAPAVVPSQNIVIPDYITTNDGEVYPVTSIGNDAFIGKGDTVTSISLGKMLSNISSGCFDGSDIESVTIADGNDSFTVDENCVIYGSDGSVIYDPANTVSIVPSPKEGCLLDIRELNGRYYYFRKDEGYSLKEIAAEYGTDEYFATSPEGRVLGPDDVPSTGTVLNLGGARIYVVLLGDADGDGEISSYDYLLVKRTYLGTYFPIKSQFYAIAVSNGKEVCSYDYLLVKRHVLGTYDLLK